MDHLETEIKKFGESFYKPNMAKRLKEGKALPRDPFRVQWPELGIADVFRKADDLDAYDHLYRDSSNRTHWTAKGIYDAVEFGSLGEFTYVKYNPVYSVKALGVGVASVIDTMTVANNYAGFGLEDELYQFKLEVAAVSAIGPSKSKPEPLGS